MFQSHIKNNRISTQTVSKCSKCATNLVSLLAHMMLFHRSMTCLCLSDSTYYLHFMITFFETQLQFHSSMQVQLQHTLYTTSTSTLISFHANVFWNTASSSTSTYFLHFMLKFFETYELNLETQLQWIFHQCKFSIRHDNVR